MIEPAGSHHDLASIPFVLARIIHTRTAYTHSYTFKGRRRHQQLVNYARISLVILNSVSIIHDRGYADARRPAGRPLLGEIPSSELERCCIAYGDHQHDLEAAHSQPVTPPPVLRAAGHGQDVDDPCDGQADVRQASGRHDARAQCVGRPRHLDRAQRDPGVCVDTHVVLEQAQADHPGRM